MWMLLIVSVVFFSFLSYFCHNWHSAAFLSFSANKFSHSALICLQLCLFHFYPRHHLALLPCPTDRGSVRWIVFFESLLLSEIIHMHLFNSFYVRHKLHIPKLILINAVSCCLITERFIHVSWNASCKRSCRSLCWITKMKFWPHWTRLLMTQVSRNVFIFCSSLEVFINHGKSENELSWSNKRTIF